MSAGRINARLALLTVLLSALALGAGLVLVPGCGDGDDDTSGCRIRIVTAAIDGEIDVPLFLRRTTHERHVLEPVEGGRPGEMFAVGAPEGRYTVESDGGWGSLWVGLLPILHPEQREPTAFPLGRGRTLYVGARDQDLGRVGREWVVEREIDGVRHRLDVPVEQAPEFELVALRFPEDEWHGGVFVTGRMADGTIVRSFPFDIGENDDQPRMTFAMRAPLTTLAVHVVPFAPGGDADAFVEVEPIGAPLSDRIREPATGGVAGFAAIPDLGLPLRVFLPDTTPPWSFDIPERELLRLGCAYVLADGGRRVEIESGADPDLVVQVRGAGSRAYGRVALERDDDRVFVRVPAGRQHWLARAGSSWAAFEVRVPAEGEYSVELPPLEPGATVRGAVVDPARGPDAAAGPGHRVLFFRMEGDLRVLGGELDVSVGERGRYEAHLPAGSYQAQVQGPRGRLGAVVEMQLGPKVVRRQTFELD